LGKQSKICLRNETTERWFTKKMLVLNSERQSQFSLKKSFTNLAKFAKNTLVRGALMEPDTAAVFRSDRKTYGKTYV